MTLQMAMFTPKSEWVPPHELPDLTDYDIEHVTQAMQRIDSSRIATLMPLGDLEEFKDPPDCTLDTIEDYRKLLAMEW